MIKRELYMNRIRPFIGGELIKVMTGIRRSGKSVMLELIKEELAEAGAVSYTHLRAHETRSNLVCRLLLEKIFFNDTATTEIYTRKIVGSVRCV